MYALPSAWWPKSKTWTMPGSPIAVAARASLKKRVTIVRLAIENAAAAP